MKIGIINPAPMISEKGGVKVQAEMWQYGFELLGHECTLVNMWKTPNWERFDVMIVIGTGGMFRILLDSIRSFNCKIVLAPILDPTYNKYIFKFFCKYWGSHKMIGLTSPYRDLYDGCKKADLFFTRSKLETEYLSYCCDVPKEKIHQIPLSVRFQPLEEMPLKENFCYHTSRLASYDKNVGRLIAAAKKYNFKLVLSGVLNGDKEKQWLKEQIGDSTNIEYVGLVSEDELKSLYKRAKVFALPSMVEGVGMVALEAAGYGAEIVLTNLGAPKEYWDGQAFLVNPLSVDEIGQAIMKCLNGEHKMQPQLMRFIDEKYSVRACTEMIVDALMTMKD